MKALEKEELTASRTLCRPRRPRPTSAVRNWSDAKDDYLGYAGVPPGVSLSDLQRTVTLMRHFPCTSFRRQLWDLSVLAIEGAQIPSMFIDANLMISLGRGQAPEIIRDAKGSQSDPDASMGYMLPARS